PKGAPDWLHTVPVRSRGGSETVDYVVIEDVADLVWLAQVASVECHAWTSRWPDLDEPDFAVLDLDPHEPISFDETKRVALLVKVLLDRLELVGFPKTSGGAGIQIFIPLAAGHTFEEVRAFCAAMGGLLRAAYPQGVTLEPQKPKRAGKVFIDVDQNAKGQTLVAPYSVRPYPGAPVSTPLEWSELEGQLYPEQLTITTVFEHLKGRPDPFAPALSLRQDLKPILRRLQASPENN
ncbi:MAG: DNA polymerase domain-containing protein, partial [Actinomycetota bacterium]